MTHEMAKEKQCEDLQTQVDRLTFLLHSFYDPEAPFGFHNIEPSLSEKMVKVSNPGLLEGSCGILLTLSSLSNSSSNWHLPLLIHA